MKITFYLFPSFSLSLFCLRSLYFFLLKLRMLFETYLGSCKLDSRGAEPAAILCTLITLQPDSNV